MSSVVDNSVVVPAINVDMEDSLASSHRGVDGDNVSLSSTSSLSSLSKRGTNTGSSTSSKPSRKIRENVNDSKTITIKTATSPPNIEKDDTGEIKNATSTTILTSTSLAHAMTDKEGSTLSRTPSSSPEEQDPSQKIASNDPINNHAVRKLTAQEQKNEEISSSSHFDSPFSKTSPSYDEEEKKDDDRIIGDTCLMKGLTTKKLQPSDAIRPYQQEEGKTYNVQQNLKDSPQFLVDGSKLHLLNENVNDEMKRSVACISGRAAFPLGQVTASSTSSAATVKASSKDVSMNHLIVMHAAKKTDTVSNAIEKESIYRPRILDNEFDSPRAQTLPSLLDGVTKALMLPSVSEMKSFPSDEVSQNNSLRSRNLTTSSGIPMSLSTANEDASNGYHEQNKFSARTADRHHSHATSPQVRYFMPEGTYPTLESRVPPPLSRKRIRSQLKLQLREHHKIHLKRPWQEQLQLQKDLQKQLNQRQKISKEQERLQEQLRNVKSPVIVPIEMDQILKQEMDARWELRVARREIIQQLELKSQMSRKDKSRRVEQTHDIQDEEAPNDNSSNGVEVYDKYDDGSKSYYSQPRMCGPTRVQCLCWVFVILSILVIASSTIIVTYVLTLLQNETESSLRVPTPTVSPVSSPSYPEMPPPVHDSRKSQVPATSVPALKSPAPSLPAIMADIYPETPPPVHESRKTQAPATLVPGLNSLAPSLGPTIELAPTSKPITQPTAASFKENVTASTSTGISIANSTEHNNTMKGDEDTRLFPTLAPTSPIPTALNNGTMRNTPNETDDQSSMVVGGSPSFNNATNSSSSSGLIEEVPTASPTVGQKQQQQQLDGENSATAFIHMTNMTNTTLSAEEVSIAAGTGGGAIESTKDEKGFKSIFD